MFLVHLIMMVPLFADHQYVNLWQHSARQRVWDEFPKDAVLIELDFAENFSIIVQDEQQAGHWTHKQVTLLICILRYHDTNGKQVLYYKPTLLL